MILANTRKALAIYAYESILLDQELRNIKDEKQLWAWEESNDAAMNRVREAFYQDCLIEGIPNSRDHCMIVDMATLKRWCA